MKYRLETLEELKARMPDYKSMYRTGWCEEMKDELGNNVDYPASFQVVIDHARHGNYEWFTHVDGFAYDKTSLVPIVTDKRPRAIEEGEYATIYWLPPTVDQSDVGTVHLVTKKKGDGSFVLKGKSGTFTEKAIHPSTFSEIVGAGYDTENESESNNNNKSIIDKPMAKFSNWAQVRSEVAKNFIKSKNIIDIMELGIETEKNVFLFGRGGHGKSEISDEVFKHLGVTPFVQSCGDGLTEEKLFGGLNLKIFQDTGDIFFNVENSFMNSEYVILEEFLDAPMNVLLSLKDILTAGEFRQGSQRFPIKTKCVIALTNRTKAEVSEDDSIKALMERFPLGRLVEWDTYNRDDFMKLFTTVKSDKKSSHRKEMQVLSNIIAKSIEGGKFISPRTAIHCLDVVIKAGFDKLVYIDGLDGSMIKDTLADFKRIENISKNQSDISAIVTRFDTQRSKYYKDDVSPTQQKEAIKNMKAQIANLSNLEVEDDNVSLKKDHLSNLDAKMRETVDNFLS